MKFQDRIQELIRVKASELRKNQGNWRTHPKHQSEALRGILKEVGWVSAVIARKTDDGIEIIDGHLRTDLADNDLVPVLVTDLTDDEAKQVLATYDPIGDLAQRDNEKLDELLQETKASDKAVDELLRKLQGKVEQSEERASVEEMLGLPIQLAWVAIAIPIDRYGEIAGFIQRLAEDEGVVVETSVS